MGLSAIPTFVFVSLLVAGVLVVPAASGGGAVYIRWGREDCPTTSQLAYKGYAAGGHFMHTGSGSNYVCLTDNPQWGTYSDTDDSEGTIYGAEYQLTKNYGGNVNFPFTNTLTKLYNKDVPCAVCHSIRRAGKMMVPGTNTCPAGWTEEYDGYLVSGLHVHPGQVDYVCMDGQPKAATYSDSSNNDGALFYPVEAKCGALPCGPYVHNRELTCVVCTK